MKLHHQARRRGEGRGYRPAAVTELPPKRVYLHAYGEAPDGALALGMARHGE